MVRAAACQARRPRRSAGSDPNWVSQGSWSRWARATSWAARFRCAVRVRGARAGTSGWEQAWRGDGAAPREHDEHRESLRGLHRPDVVVLVRSSAHSSGDRNMVMPYCTDDAVTLYHGDAAATPAHLAPGSVSCIVSSPPHIKPQVNTQFVSCSHVFMLVREPNRATIRASRPRGVIVARL